MPLIATRIKYHNNTHMTFKPPRASVIYSKKRWYPFFALLNHRSWVPAKTASSRRLQLAPQPTPHSKMFQSNLSLLQQYTSYCTGMCLVMRKPALCICENKDADQLRGNCVADQRLCFRYTDSTIPLLSKSEISSI